MDLLRGFCSYFSGRWEVQAESGDIEQETDQGEDQVLHFPLGRGRVKQIGLGRCWSGSGTWAHSSDRRVADGE